MAQWAQGITHPDHREFTKLSLAFHPGGWQQPRRHVLEFTYPVVFALSADNGICESDTVEERLILTVLWPKGPVQVWLSLLQTCGFPPLTPQSHELRKSIYRFSWWDWLWLLSKASHRGSVDTPLPSVPQPAPAGICLILWFMSGTGTRLPLWQGGSACREIWLRASQACQQMREDICQQQEACIKHRKLFWSRLPQPVLYRRHLAGIHGRQVLDVEDLSSARYSFFFPTFPLPGLGLKSHLLQEAFLDYSAKVRTLGLLPSYHITSFSLCSICNHFSYFYTSLISTSPNWTLSSVRTEVFLFTISTYLVQDLALRHVMGAWINEWKIWKMHREKQGPLFIDNIFLYFRTVSFLWNLSN